MVGLCPRMWLHVGVFRSEQFLHPLDGQSFHLIDNLAAAIVAFAGISFSIFVREIGAHGLHDFITYEIFRSDKLHAFQLTLMFFLNEIEDFLVSFHFTGTLMVRKYKNDSC